jgi:class 3 adenylate cyclase
MLRRLHKGMKGGRGYRGGIPRQGTGVYAPVEDPDELCTLEMWDRVVYADLLACRDGHLSEAAFHARHRYTTAILGLDMTGFTHDSIDRGDLHSMLRILDVHRICLPVFRAHGATRTRAFADDLYATFTDPNAALRCALDLHRRVAAFNSRQPADESPASCCVGLGYGQVLRIGPDSAMGREMNRTSKLGEDIARAGETLATESFRAAVDDAPGCRFEPRRHPDLEFTYFAVLQDS